MAPAVEYREGVFDQVLVVGVAAGPVLFAHLFFHGKLKRLFQHDPVPVVAVRPVLGGAYKAPEGIVRDLGGESAGEQERFLVVLGYGSLDFIAKPLCQQEPVESLSQDQVLVGAAPVYLSGQGPQPHRFKQRFVPGDAGFH